MATDFPDATESCVLDVAERGEHTLAEVGEAIGLTRQRIQQIETGALARRGLGDGLADFSDHQAPESHARLVDFFGDDEDRDTNRSVREPNEREPMWLRSCDPRVTDEEYCGAVYRLYERAAKPPCPERGCLVSNGHEGDHALISRRKR